LTRASSPATNCVLRISPNFIVSSSSSFARASQ
jgi:hypothetical protein